MKHNVYLAYYNPVGGMQTYRCDNCDAQAHLGVWQLEDKECPNTGAPDWAAIDKAERDAYMKRFKERHFVGLQDP